jgi:hypothetical protein
VEETPVDCDVERRAPVREFVMKLERSRFSQHFDDIKRQSHPHDKPHAFTAGGIALRQSVDDRRIDEQESEPEDGFGEGSAIRSHPHRLRDKEQSDRSHEHESRKPAPDTRPLCRCDGDGGVAVWPRWGYRRSSRCGGSGLCQDRVGIARGRATRTQSINLRLVSAQVVPARDVCVCAFLLPGVGLHGRAIRPRDARVVRARGRHLALPPIGLV